MFLDQPVSTLKGIGEKTSALLEKAGINTVRDFFYHLPRDYQNYASPTQISEIKPGPVVIKGKIDQLTTRRTRRRNFTITEGIIRDSSGAIRVIWFNQSYRTKQFDPQKEYYFTGTYELSYGRYQLTSPSALLATDLAKDQTIQPIYPARGPLKSSDFKRLIANSRSKFSAIPDLLPGVPPHLRQNALYDLHFPSHPDHIKTARTYLAYEELFALILSAKLNQIANQKLRAPKIPFQADQIRRFLRELPFKLTNAQRLATWEILQDLARPTLMNRLLQGDVGSGKTLVSALSAFATALAHKQSVLLAPTAILATQHYENLRPLFENFGLKVALLTSATKQKPALKSAIKAGHIDIIIGTHALLTDDTEFSDLALVIIDEQHRFGVKQRQNLLLKSPPGSAPHLLTMTATPIPRSLQLTIFGDLDISLLNELPKGRQAIKTKILPEINLKTDLYPKMQEILAQNQQIYWVCPAIEDQSKTTTASVKTRAEKLTKAFPGQTVAYLHGRMKPAEKDQIMADFVQQKIHILVSTTVIEVGIDVKNATLMVIENAESFGLSALHQLRGRVGRGSNASFCFLLTPEDHTPSRRLKALEKSTDGFHLAEVDLKLRGPGEIYGALQHGALNLKIASFSDTKLIKQTATAVDLFLQNPKNMLKYKELMQSIKKYQQLTTLN